MHPSPQYFEKYIVLSDTRESTNIVKKGVVKEFFSDRAFSCEERVIYIYDILHSKDTENLTKRE